MRIGAYEDKQAQLEEIMKKIPAEKYYGSGIYCIKANDKIVYIGQSKDMIVRVANHVWEIEYGDKKETKYRILAEMREEYNISFDVMCYCDEDKLTLVEDGLIRGYLPMLNTVIPGREAYRISHISPKKLLNGKWREYI